jgi:manganese transport protein
MYTLLATIPEFRRHAAIGNWRRALPVLGPGYLVAVGYVDPGNWATDIAAGAKFGYALLFVVAMSSIVAAFLQMLTVRLALATGTDLATMIRDRLPRPLALTCWAAAELAMVATDLAELLGAAVALHMLFGLAIPLGTVLNAAVTVLLLAMPRRRGHLPEYFVGLLLLVITLCFAYELALLRPALGAVIAGLSPSTRLVRDPAMLYLALGIVGATIMPHNLYLHSGLALKRIAASSGTPAQRFRLLSRDLWIALGLAGLVNGAIVIVAAELVSGADANAGLEDAYRLLGPTLGAGAGIVFAVGLLAAGQSATTTASMAGAMVLEGFFKLRVSPWLRLLVTRVAALALALLLTLSIGTGAVDRLLVLSQVALSLTLPFVLAPLLFFLRDRGVMRLLPVPRTALEVVGLLVIALTGLNLWLATVVLA